MNLHTPERLPGESWLAYEARRKDSRASVLLRTRPDSPKPDPIANKRNHKPYIAGAKK